MADEIKYIGMPAPGQHGPYGFSGHRFGHGMRLDFADLCIFRVVYGDDLENWTRDGWRVLAAFPDQRKQEIHHTCSEGHYGKKCQHGYDNWHEWIENELVWTTAYLIAEARDDTLANLREQVSDTTSQLYSAKRQASEAHNAHESITKKLDAMTKERDTLAEESENRRLRNIAQDEAKSKLERDLAKIRAAIGTRAFNEIIGAKNG